MARLLILRGGILDREVELRNRTLKLGRGGQNDVILEDEGKSVSRNHAEIRYENGRYLLVDLESQNGVWVSGARVPYVVLEPNVVASLGPYRLMLESGAPAEVDRQESGTFTATVAAPQADFPDAVRKDHRSDPRGGMRPGAGADAGWFGRQPKWLLATAGAAAVGVSAVAVATIMRDPSPPGGDEVAALMDAQLTAAAGLIQSGECARALSDHIELVLASDPANPRALQLKGEAEVCGSLAPPPSLPVAPTGNELTPEAVKANLEAAARLIDGRDCLVAINDHLQVILDSDPANAEALMLKAKADACLAPPPPPEPAPAPALARRTPPEKGGLELMPGELQRDYDVRVRAMRARYDEAQAALSSGAYQTADDLLSAIVRDAGDRYLEAGRLLLQAKNGRKDQAMKIYQGARELEGRDEWDRAIQEFRRAQETDPSTFSVDGDIKRVTEKKTALGLKQCEVANANFAFGRNALAQQAYEDVIRLLPADHKCVGVAKERLALIRK